MKLSNTVGMMLAAGVLSACSLAPKYERPAAPVAADFPVMPPAADGKGPTQAMADAKGAVEAVEGGVVVALLGPPRPAEGGAERQADTPGCESE